MIVGPYEPSCLACGFVEYGEDEVALSYQLAANAGAFGKEGWHLCGPDSPMRARARNRLRRRERVDGGGNETSG
jgi:hypothetical protein